MTSEYVDVNSKIFMDEIITLLDGFNDEYAYGHTKWSYMSREDKEKWFRDFSDRAMQERLENE